jgi:mRNA-degrading endonuclease toxin of MazEF toxin-antitoxin module
MSSAPSPQRGEVWLADLDPTFGHEQGGRRPVLIVSVDAFNAGLSGLVVVLPLTSRLRPLPLHVPVHPPKVGCAGPAPSCVMPSVPLISGGSLIAGAQSVR